jgi:hypothetical protein
MQLAQEALTCAAQVAVGGAAFILTLAASQVFQGGVLRVSCCTSLGVPAAIGAVSVAGGGIISLRAGQLAGDASRGVRVTPELVLDRLWAPVSEKEKGVAALSLALFTCLGGGVGAFSGIAPSVVSNVGAFGQRRASLPATVEYATSDQRAVMTRLGRIFGCHTCGNASQKSYISDHMPPLKYVKEENARIWRRILMMKVTQRFYPQCVNCSSVQSSAVRTRTRKLVYHFASLRAQHCTGALVVFADGCLGSGRRRRLGWVFEK